MALLGPQLVITLVMVSFIQKLGNHLSLAKWMLCSTGLTRYLYPTDDELRSLAGIHRTSKGNRKGRFNENGKVSETFHVPRNLDIQLEKSKVVLLDIVHLRFYSEYQWLLDFSVYAAIVYFLTEICQVLFKMKEEFNLSMLWCFLVVGFASKILVSLTRQYFKCEESGERSTVIVTGFAYMVLAMAILIVDESNLELGLETAYKSFNKSAAMLLEKQGLNSSGPASKIVLKFFLALWCGVMGALFTFPGLRTARMHWDALHVKFKKLTDFGYKNVRTPDIIKPQAQLSSAIHHSHFRIYFFYPARDCLGFYSGLYTHVYGIYGLANRLNEYILHYESLNYDTSEVHKNHQRAKRSVVKDHHVHISFHSHGRNFNLRLKRDLDVFSDNLMVDGVPDIDTSHIYNGYIIGEPGSRAFGSIIDGIFEGSIQALDESYYVEKAHRYFPKDSNNSFHSVIYKGKDLNDSYFGGCGVTEDVLQWMDKIQNSGVSKEESVNDNRVMDTYDSNEKYSSSSYLHSEPEKPYQKYSLEFNEGEYKSRRKRATRPKEENRNTCSLFIQTDPLIWRHIGEQVNNDPEKTREEILSLIAHHVTAVNYIYRDTKFDGRIEHRNIKFEVQRIKIDDYSPCLPNYNGEVNPFCMENIDVSNFLNLHSLGNHEDFCLAYVFTYRDFTGGTLGLAWVASASGASGGICEKYKPYTETVGSMYQSTKRSLNTGIITFVNYNTRVPPKVSQLTLAHEIGHNFGSPHDFPPECRPGGLNGNYIMFASATSGDRPNNSKFSGCSVGNISNVLDAIEDNKKRNCFTASAGAFCGNKIVEAGEECDCGYDDDECKDKCCYPRLVSEKDRLTNENARGCTRRRGAVCSPSQGPCCSSETCTFVPSHHRQQCKSESDCSWSSVCNGKSSECPNPLPKANKTRCNEGTQLCINGECTGSICLEWNLTECFLTSHIIPNIDKRRLCELACQNGTDASTCRSTSEFAHLVGLPQGGISLRPGSPCDNFQGYCDVFFKCRAVDAEGPLARLKNLLFNKETLTTVFQWVTEYWWAVLLMGLAFIVFMGLFIKCCAVHTPSSNPRKPPARRLSETLRLPITSLRRMRHPHGGPGNRGMSRPGPVHGYGANRGQYYAPKPSAPPSGFSRSSQNHYAGAYGGRQNVFEMRQNKV